MSLGWDVPFGIWDVPWQNSDAGSEVQDIYSFTPAIELQLFWEYMMKPGPPLRPGLLLVL